ncbi:hypothetical protein BC833DRAFT_624516 [Globomyces pollinis-pini]|nr:hypothetical protein BC833DRAFT_624516 [Globomyces pollinis-pini]
MSNNAFNQLGTCQGLRKDGYRCNSKVREFGDKYCIPLHDPELKGNITDTSIFRIPLVRESFPVIDRYRDTKLEKGFFETDHIMEVHIFRDVYDVLKLGKSSEKQNIIDWISLNINKSVNLNPTLPWINYKKFKGVRSYMIDYYRDSVNDAGIVSYFREGGIKNRKITAAITKEMKIAHDVIVDGFQADKRKEQNYVDEYLEVVDKMRFL